MKYDVFISYAVEDKYPVAAGIAMRLKEAGLKVYFVGDRLTAGDLISDTVNHGLEESHFCVMIISPNYIRHWPAIERNHILNRERKERKKLIFPIWYNISREEVAKNFPELIDHYAPSLDIGLDAVAEHLQRAIHKRKSEEVTPSRFPIGTILIVLAGIILMVMAVSYVLNEEPRDPEIRNTHPLAPNENKY